MPLRFRVQEFAVAKGFPNARRLAQKTGISFNTVYGLWDNTKKYVHLGVLERIADELGVPPEMLLTTEPLPTQRHTPRRGRPRLEKPGRQD